MSWFANAGYDMVSPLVALWNSFIGALPGFLLGLLILVFGYLFGEVLEILIIKGLKKIKFNKFIHKLNISKTLESFDISHFIGVLVKWYIFVIFLLVAASGARLGEFSIYLRSFAQWAPKFLLAILIVVFAWVAIDVIATKIESTKVKSKHLISWIVKTVLILYVLVNALDLIGLELVLLHQTFIILLSAFAFGVALAIGIGFGLAMKDDAKKTVKSIFKKL